VPASQFFPYEGFIKRLTVRRLSQSLGSGFLPFFPDPFFLNCITGDATGEKSMVNARIFFNQTEGVKSEKALSTELLAPLYVAWFGATRNSKSAARLCCHWYWGGCLYGSPRSWIMPWTLQGTGVQVIRDGDQIQLIIPSNITFNTAEYDIKSSFYASLNSVAKVLYKYKDTNLTAYYPQLLIMKTWEF